VYKTKAGKIVYGGGGITPDYFVAIDTSSFTLNVAKTYSKGIISNYAYRYYLQNLTQLNNYKTTDDFTKKFVLSEDSWKQFVAFAAKDSIILNAVTAKEKADITNRIISSIARQVWRTEGMVEVLNKNDNAVKKAIEILTQ
jgi:carboxyl-terminal processing protease